MLSPSSLIRASRFTRPTLCCQTLIFFSSQPSPPWFSKNKMAGDQIPDEHRGWRSSPRVRVSVSSSKSSRSGVRQTSSEMKGGSDVRGTESDSKVSFGKSSIHWKDGSSRSCDSDCRNKSPQPIWCRSGPASPMMEKGSTNVGGPGNDSKVPSGKSSIHLEDRSSSSFDSDCRKKSPQPELPRSGLTKSEMVQGSSNLGGPESDSALCIFDICRSKTHGIGKLNKSLFEQNREKRREREHRKHVSQHLYLRPGMVLLKNFIGHQDQVRIIEECKKLGIGQGGFYRPGYRDGSKLHLQMMCLGKNWDPESRMYGDIRHTDGAKPPKIPEDFCKLVEGAIHAAYDFLNRNTKGINEVELPRMSPDVCIVNFYSNNGKLGLHQDRDESEDSIQRGVPIVSFSVGDSAEFLYGEKRDVDMAEKVVLESGDILIFGGKSRLIFHGVSSIFPNTAPKSLIEETGLKPGRLNLTFRQL